MHTVSIAAFEESEISLSMGLKPKLNDDDDDFNLIIFFFFFLSIIIAILVLSEQSELPKYILIEQL